MPTRILLADDHALMRRALRALLEAEPDLAVVGEAAGAEEALEAALELRPDVVVMDLAMPGGGVEATRGVTALTRARVLVFSMLDEEIGLASALRAGASGYVAKTAAPDALLRAIRRVAAGGAVLSPAAVRALVRR
jgi:DNA-binding NarL/FixJ family response regulator